MIRKEILEKAIQYTCSDRNLTYGEPTVNMQCLGELIKVYKKYSNNSSISHETCMFQVFAKIARIACGVLKDDNYIDLGAYAAMAYECAVNEKSVDCDCITCTCGNS